MPRSLAVVTGYRCNIRCTYCFNETHEDTAIFVAKDLLGSAKRPNIWDRLAVESVVNSADEAGYQRIVLTGGEPFAFPHVDFWIESVLASEMQLGIITNATMMKPRHLELLANHMERVFFSVSIGGISEESHNRYREAWARTVRGMASIADHGMGMNLSMVLTRSGFQDIFGYEEFAARYGAVPRLAALSVDGGALGEMPDEELAGVTREQWMAAVAAVKKPELRRDLLWMMAFYLHNVKVHDCGMRTQSQVLLPDGEVVGCFHLPEARLGNVFDEKISSLLESIDTESAGPAPCFGEHCLTLQFH